jgi:phosphoribosyl 1,2-cyclic phosphate phosphodiesterase
VLAKFREMFRYIFEPHLNENPSFVPELLSQRIEPAAAIDLFGARWTPLRLLHGKLAILGFRVDLGGRSMAYCTDVSAIPDETLPLLKGLDVFVIDGLRYRPHPTHFTIDQALAMIDRLQPRAAYLTHLAHDVAHADLAPRLPPGVHLPHDGLIVRLGVPNSPGQMRTVPR